MEPYKMCLQRGQLNHIYQKMFKSLSLITINTSTEVKDYLLLITFSH